MVVPSFLINPKTIALLSIFGNVLGKNVKAGHLRVTAMEALLTLVTNIKR